MFQNAFCSSSKKNAHRHYNRKKAKEEEEEEKRRKKKKRKSKLYINTCKRLRMQIELINRSKWPQDNYSVNKKG